MMTQDTERPVCDYEGYAYQEFWKGGRDYEDAVERIALHHMLPPSGNRLAEIGAGYGRLVPLYSGYKEVVLVDHALSQLQEARRRWGSNGPDGLPLYKYIAADFYNLPISPGSLDTVTMVRALHHAMDAPAVLSGVAGALAPQGTFILEYANKCNLKAILRYFTRRQTWSPFDQAPVEFMELHYNFHPAWIRSQLARVGLRVKSQRTVSHFRIDLLKRLIPTKVLAALDSMFQPTGALWQLTPSVFIRSLAPRDNATPGESIFRCVACGTGPLEEQANEVQCASCKARYAIIDGIYDLRSPSME